MKVQGLLLSYITTVMLVEKNKKVGRELGDKMMARFRKHMPMTFEMAVKQYKIFRLMNGCHISKKTWEAVSHSKIYNMLRHNHDFN